MRLADCVDTLAILEYHVTEMASTIEMTLTRCITLNGMLQSRQVRRISNVMD